MPDLSPTVSAPRAAVATVSIGGRFVADASFNTLAPSFQLLLDGSPAPIDLSVNVIGIRVTEDLTRPSRFTLNVSDVGRVWTKSNKFKSGREVEVKLGFVSKMESVIRAEVHSWEVDLAADGPARLVVQGYDRLHRFTRGPKTRTFVDQKDSEIVRKIAQEHGLSADVDDSQALHPFVLQHNVPDFDFILERAALCGFEVQVQGKKLLFKKPAVTGQPAVKLTWGENIGRIAHEINTFDQAPKIEARAWDPVNQKLLTAPAKAGDELSKMGGQTLGARLAKDRFGEAQQYVLSAATSLKELESVVKAEYNRRAGNFVQIECRVDGNPRIRAGTVVEIEKAGKRLDGVYYVTWAEHAFFTDSGYFTEFRARRYTMDKGSGPPKDVTPKGLVSAIDGAANVVNALANGVEKARACFQAAKTAVEKANKTLQDAQRALNNTLAAVKTAIEAVDKAMENARDIAQAAFKEARAWMDAGQKALEDAKAFLTKAAETVGAPPEFTKALDAAFKAADNAVAAAEDGLGLAENFLTEGGGLLDKADELWEEVKKQLGGGAGEGPLPAGGKIAPPRLAVIASSEADEKAWFQRLEKVALADLQPGDLLLEKRYDDPAHPVVKAQGSLVADKGSPFTAHALLFLGDGEVAHLTPEGFQLESLQGRAKAGRLKRVIVYRATNAQAAASAVEVARRLGEQSPKHSLEPCFGVPFRNYSWNPQARERAAKVAAGKLPAEEMGAAELVACCFQGQADAYMKVDARRLSPLELEDWLNDGNAFAFAGALGPAELAGDEILLDDLKQQGAAFKEAGTEAKNALQTAQASVAQSATAVSRASANDPAGAEAITAQAEQKREQAGQQAEAASASAGQATGSSDPGPEATATSAASPEAVSTPGAASPPAAQAPPETIQAPEDKADAPQEPLSAGASTSDEPAPEASLPNEPAETGAAPAVAKKEKAPAVAAAAPAAPDVDPASTGGTAKAGAEQAPPTPKVPEESAALKSAPAAQKSGASDMPAAPGAVDTAVASGIGELADAASDTTAAVGAVAATASGAESLLSKASKLGGEASGAGASAAGGAKLPEAAKSATAVTDAASEGTAAVKKPSVDTLEKAGAQASSGSVSKEVVAEAKKGSTGVASKAAEASSQIPASEEVKGEGGFPDVGPSDVYAARGKLREAQSDAASLQWKAENAEQVIKGELTGDLTSAARELQSEAAGAKYMAENAGSIAEAQTAGAVRQELGLRELQSDAAQAKYVAENAGSIAKNEASAAVTEGLGVKELQTQAADAQYKAQHADEIVTDRTTGEVKGAVREVQRGVDEALFEARMAADAPSDAAADARSLKLKAATRAKNIAEGDLSEAQRTAGELGGLADDLDLPDDLPEPPDEGAGG